MSVLYMHSHQLVGSLEGRGWRLAAADFQDQHWDSLVVAVAHIDSMVRCEEVRLTKGEAVLALWRLAGAVANYFRDFHIRLSSNPGLDHCYEVDRAVLHLRDCAAGWNLGLNWDRRMGSSNASGVCNQVGEAVCEIVSAKKGLN